MFSLLNLIVTIIDLLTWVIIIWAVMSWLTAFNIINTNNRFVLSALDTLGRITEPLLRPIRAIVPNLGGVDISPVILILLLMFLRDLVRELYGMPVMP